MTPTPQEIIDKYLLEIQDHKKRLKKIEEWLQKYAKEASDKGYFPDLSEEEYQMMVKGYKTEKRELENLIHQKIINIGRQTVKASKMVA